MHVWIPPRPSPQIKALQTKVDEALATEREATVLAASTAASIDRQRKDLEEEKDVNDGQDINIIALQERLEGDKEDFLQQVNVSLGVLRSQLSAAQGQVEELKEGVEARKCE